MKTKTLLLSAGAALALLAALLAPRAFERPAAQAGGPGPFVSVQPPSLEVDYADGTFQVSIKLTGLNHLGQVAYDDNRDTVPDRFVQSNGLGAFEFRLFFDPNLVDVVGGEPRDFIASTGRSITCLQQWPEPGEYRFGCFSTGSQDGPQGDGELAVVTLEPLANGTTPLDIDVGMAGPLGDDIPAQSAGGTVRITGAPTPTPTPTASPTPTPTATPPGGDGNNGGGNNGSGNDGGGSGNGGGTLGGGAGGDGSATPTVSALPSTGAATNAASDDLSGAVALTVALLGAGALATGGALRLRRARS